MEWEAVRYRLIPAVDYHTPQLGPYIGEIESVLERFNF